MKLDIKIIGESEMRARLRQYENALGKTVEEGIGEIARSSARELAMKVQPYGLSKKVGDKFIKNITEQIRHVAQGVNLGVYHGANIQSAHNNARRNGRVRIRRLRGDNSAKPTNEISISESDAYIEQQTAKAGRAKAAWIAAGNSIGKEKLSGIPKWISRHNSGSYGTSSTSGRRMKAEITLENRVPYIRKLQKDREIASALRTGRKKALKRLILMIEKNK
jgi:hypothetical protein